MVNAADADPLSDPVSAYSQAAKATRKFVAGIPSNVDWAGATPCAEWNVRELLAHIVNGASVVAKNTGVVSDWQPWNPDGNSLNAYDAAIAQASAAWAAPGVEGSPHDLGFATLTGHEYAKLMFIDALVHGWDLAKATGQDATLDPQLVDLAFAHALSREAMVRANPAYGGGVPDPGAAAGTQARLLALYGRKAGWPV